MFFEMRFDLGTLDSGEPSLPFGLLVIPAMVKSCVCKAGFGPDTLEFSGLI